MRWGDWGQAPLPKTLHPPCQSRRQPTNGATTPFVPNHVTRPPLSADEAAVRPQVSERTDLPADDAAALHPLNLMGQKSRRCPPSRRVPHKRAAVGQISTHAAQRHSAPNAEDLSEQRGWAPTALGLNTTRTRRRKPLVTRIRPRRMNRLRSGNGIRRHRSVGLSRASALLHVLLMTTTR